DPDPAKAERALWALAPAPDLALPRLREALRPREKPDLRGVPALVRDLDADDFTRREAAARELARLGAAALPAAEAALREGPTPERNRRPPEVRAQVRAALEQESITAIRPVLVLEHIGSADSRQLLREVADRDPDSPLAREARAALGRLRARDGAK